MRADSAFYGHATRQRRAQRRRGRVGHRPDGPAVKAAIAGIPDDAWTHDRVHRRRLRRDAPAAGSPGPRSPRSRSPRSPRRRRPTRSPAARRAPHPRPERQKKRGRRQDTLFDDLALPRVLHHQPTRASDGSTPSPPTRPTAHHAIIEQVHADLKNSALAHLPSGSSPRTPPGSCWRSSRSTSPAPPPPSPAPTSRKATTATIRRKLIPVPARVATSARRITLHLPKHWPWQDAWTALFDRVSDPPPAPAT